jgi:hypothetical protein
MKKYLAILYGESRMGNSAEYRLLKENEIKSLKLYGEFVRLYELTSPNPLSKEQGTQLGLKYLSPA